MDLFLIWRWDLAEWFERLIANTKVATVLGSIPASSDSGIREVEDEVLLNEVILKPKKYSR